MSWELRLGDCLCVLRSLDSESADALVTDPPAGIGFMGKEWDKDKGGRDAWIGWLCERMAECLRVLKPGAHGLVWALPRTSGWTQRACEDAGFEIRDRVSHFFGSGFPKSLNLGDGRGTALKPACEDWWLIRRPLDGTVAANVAEHGTGALNIDACRIGTSKTVPVSPAKDRIGQIAKGDERGRTSDTDGFDPGVGRWPANIVFSHSPGCGDDCAPDCAVAELDRQSGELTSGTRRAGIMASRRGHIYSPDAGYLATEDIIGSTGGASRFFYVAKPATSERDAGLDHLAAKSGGEATGRKDDSEGLKSPRAGAGRNGGRKNIHPTVKPIELMRYLCRLITPPRGTVLDCFLGSGTTGVAALAEGFNFIGIEREEEYLAIARARIEEDMPLFNRKAAK